MNEPDAIEFSESFGMIGAGWWRQVAWADRQGIPKTLDLTTREWVEKYVGGYVKLTLEDRRAAVLELTAEHPKPTQAEIADILGVHEATVSRDLADARGEAPPEREDEPAVLQMQDEETEARPLTPAEVRGPSFERIFRHALRNFRAEYGEFASRKRYAALFAAIDKALED